MQACTFSLDRRRVKHARPECRVVNDPEVDSIIDLIACRSGSVCHVGHSNSRRPGSDNFVDRLSYKLAAQALLSIFPDFYLKGGAGNELCLKLM